MNTQKTALEIYDALLNEGIFKKPYGNAIMPLNIIQRILDEKAGQYPKYLFEFYNKMSSVPEWSREKGLVPETSDQESIKMALQILKNGEEFGELCSSFLRNEDKKFDDSIGDVLFTITVLCAQQNKNPFLIFNEVFEEVLNRKGKHNGKSFVKENELTKDVPEINKNHYKFDSDETIRSFLFPAEKENPKKEPNKYNLKYFRLPDINKKDLLKEIFYNLNSKQELFLGSSHFSEDKFVRAEEIQNNDCVIVAERSLFKNDIERKTILSIDVFDRYYIKTK